MTRSALDDTPIGLQRWNRLSIARRFAIAQRVVRLRIPQWLKEHPGTVSVGVGHKLTRTLAQKRTGLRLPKPPKRGKNSSQRREQSQWRLGSVARDQICIRFVMRSKWSEIDSPDRAQHPERIPSLIHSTTVIKGRRVRVSIPTDVDQHSIGTVQANLDATDGIRVVEDGNSTNRCLGSFCCVVRNRQRPSERHLLSCHHVLTLSANSPIFSPAARTDVRLRNPDISGGKLFDYASLGDGTEFGCDAALAKLTMSDNPQVWGVVPTGIAGPFDHPISLSVAVPRQNPTSPRRSRAIAAEFIDIQFGPLMRFNENVAVRFEAVLRYRTATVAGDSGSAVVGPDGTLFGMHFYEFDDGVACAIPAYVLFRPGLFAISIKL